MDCFRLSNPEVVCPRVFFCVSPSLFRRCFSTQQPLNRNYLQRTKPELGAMHKCCVCSSGSPKYRCPGCRARYCSVSCCKTHKEQCINKATQGVTDVPSSSVRREELLKYKGDDLLDEDEESDRIPEDRLKLLGESDKLKYLLLNPHLRKLLTNLDHSEKKEATVKEYMQEPLFVEFADRCLSIVEPDEKENRFPE